MIPWAAEEKGQIMAMNRLIQEVKDLEVRCSLQSACCNLKSFREFRNKRDIAGVWIGWVLSVHLEINISKKYLKIKEQYGVSQKLLYIMHAVQFYCTLFLNANLWPSLMLVMRHATVQCLNGYLNLENSAFFNLHCAKCTICFISISTLLRILA